MPRYIVGSKQAEHELQGESMEEDDIVISRYSNTQVQRRTDGEEGATSLKEFIRRCQGLAEG